MRHYKLIRISYWPVLLTIFCGVALCCELIGIFAAIWDHEWSPIVGGAFFGLLFGIASSLCAAVSIFVYHLFLPVTGGISLYLESDAPNSAEERQ